MPSSKDFKYFKPCPHCDGQMGARCMKELERKKYCSNKCAAHSRKSTLSPEDRSKIQVARSYKMMNDNSEKYIKHLLMKRDRKNLTYTYIEKLLADQKGLCALSGVEMTFKKIPNQPKVHTNLSIDRIDSSKPYEEGNIQLVCAVVNIMKTTLTVDELKGWCKLIAKEV